MPDLALPRRQFLASALALLAAPAVVRAASIMPVRALAPSLTIAPQRTLSIAFSTLIEPALTLDEYADQILTINMITREAVKLFRNSNAFLQSIDRPYAAPYAASGAKIGTQLRIRLPSTVGRTVP